MHAQTKCYKQKQKLQKESQLSAASNWKAPIKLQTAQKPSRKARKVAEVNEV